MRTSPIWERNKQVKRRALMEAAARLFRERGYDATTVEDIAALAGTSASTFFRYFGSKGDVLFADIREITDEAEVLMRAPLKDGATRWQQVERAIVGAIDRVGEPGAEFRSVTIASWLHEPDIHRRFIEYTAELELVIAEALASDRGSRPEDDLRACFMASVATSAYVVAFRMHAQTGQDPRPLVSEAFALLEGWNAGESNSSRRRRATA